MAGIKTTRTRASVTRFLAGLPDPRQRTDARRLAAIFRAATGERPAMWGPSIVGYGTRRLRYADGHEIEWMVAGFSPRKAALVLYLHGGNPRHKELLGKLGKHRMGGSCLYIRRLEEVDAAVLERLVKESAAHVRHRDRERGAN